MPYGTDHYILAEVWQPDVLNDEQYNGYSLQFVAMVNITGDTDADEVLELIFRALNGVPYDATEDAISAEWYAQNHRSLSVGDVVQLNGIPFRCDPDRWVNIHNRWL